MKKSHDCELATHIGSESCGAAREGGTSQNEFGQPRCPLVFCNVSKCNCKAFPTWRLTNPRTSASIRDLVSRW
jgi:hypothetical protein